MPFRRRGRLRAPVLTAIAALGLLTSGCGAIPFLERPARGYPYGSQEPLRVALLDATGSEAWAEVIAEAAGTYAKAAPRLRFVREPETAHIVMTVRTYSDDAPPQLDGYLFPANAGGFAAIYDADGVACNYPPSALPLTCSGEIARADLYVNVALPPGADLPARQLRLLLHEMGHGLGLTRHSPDLDVAALARRYGWVDER
jgi:hypothetical protein